MIQGCHAIPSSVVESGSRETCSVCVCVCVCVCACMCVPTGQKKKSGKNELVARVWTPTPGLMTCGVTNLTFALEYEITINFTPYFVSNIYRLWNVIVTLRSYSFPAASPPYPSEVDLQILHVSVDNTGTANVTVGGEGYASQAEKWWCRLVIDNKWRNTDELS